MNNREAYSRLRRAFEDMHLPESEAEAREVICHFAACSSGDLISKFDEEASFDCDAVIRERRSGRPLAYIIGEKHFYGLSFYDLVLVVRLIAEIVNGRGAVAPIFLDAHPKIEIDLHTEEFLKILSRIAADGLER